MDFIFVNEFPVFFFLKKKLKPECIYPILKSVARSICNLDVLFFVMKLQEKGELLVIFQGLVVYLYLTIIEFPLFSMYCFDFFSLQSILKYDDSD